MDAGFGGRYCVDSANLPIPSLISAPIFLDEQEIRCPYNAEDPEELQELRGPLDPQTTCLAYGWLSRRYPLACVLLPLALAPDSCFWVSITPFASEHLQPDLKLHQPRCCC